MRLNTGSRGVFSRIALGCGAITAGAGALILLGSVLGWDALTAMGTGYIPMAPNTALLFALLGSALLVREVWPSSRVVHRAAAAAALLSAVVAGMTLIGLNVDDMLVRNTGMLGAVPIGRMSPVTAFSFVLAGVSLLLLEFEASTWAAIPGILITLVGAVCLIGYWFGAPLLYGGTVIPVALPTSLALVALGVGLIAAAGPDTWPLNTLIGPSTRARLLRALLPTVVVLALINDWIAAILLEHSDPGIVLVSAISAILFLLVISFMVSRISGAIGDAIDQTQAERKRAEETRGKLAAIVESSNDAIISRTIDGTITSWNAAAERLFGYSAAEVIGQSMSRIIPPDLEAQAAQRRAQIAIGHTIPPYETERIAKDGRRIPVSLSQSAIRDEQGVMVGVSVIFSDISARKRADLELRRKTELAQLLEALAREANEAATPEPALRSCLERICEYGNWTLGHIAAFAQGRNSGFTETSFWHPRDPGGRYEEFIGYSDRFSYNATTGRFTGLARRERRPVWIEDLSRAGLGRISVAVKHGLRAGLALPVIVNGEVTAFLEFFAETPRPADGELMAATESVASMLARLIERAGALNALREREHLLRLVTENVPAMIAYFDSELRCRFANTAFCGFHHLDPQGVTGMTLLEITGEDTYRVIRPSIDPVKQGKPVTLRRQERTATGEIRHIEIHRVPDMSPEGAFLGYYAMVLDITERMRAEEADARLAAIIESSDDAIISRSLDLTILTWNAGAERLFGWSAEEAIGRSVSMLIPTELTEEVVRAQALLLEGRPLMPVDTVRLTKDGRRIEVSLRQSPIKDKRGELTGVSVILHDIAERRRAEQALKESEERFRTAFENAPVGMCLLGPDGAFLWVNHTFCSMLGYSQNEMCAMTFQHVTHPEDQAASVEWVRQLLAGEVKPRGFEKRYLRKDGHVVWGSVFTTLLRNADGSPRYLISHVQDITERKLAEEAHNEHEAQLRESQKMEAIGTLAGGIAHDFNNILGAIIGNAALARQDVGADHPALTSLDEVYKASQRAKNLVQQILTFSRKRPQELVIQPLRRVVDDAVKLLRATLPASVELAAAMSDPALYVLADATQIEQVLLNLCTNAWHAMKGRAGRIEIGLDAVLLDAAAVSTLSGLQPGRYARLSVSDDGCGMDAATQARIFEPFFTTKAVDQGTGLGLSVVHGIIKAHHGAITLQSAPGAGATFRIYFPVVAEPSTEALPGPAKAGPARGSGQHVLYVDDDEAMVFLVTRMLEGFGYRVSGYERGEEALAAVRAAPGDFDLVVTDFNMPGHSGLDVAQELGRIRPELPVVITSGYVTEELRANAMQAGVRHLLYKPNTVDELCELIQRLLTTGSSPGELSSNETTV